MPLRDLSETFSLRKPKNVVEDVFSEEKCFLVSFLTRFLRLTEELTTEAEKSRVRGESLSQARRGKLIHL